MVQAGESWHNCQSRSLRISISAMAVPAATDDDAAPEMNKDNAECRSKATTPVGSFEPRSLRPFSSEEEYLYAMKEDLAEWLHSLYEDLEIDVDRFFEAIDTGVLLCRHANHVLRGARETPGLRPCWPRVTYRTSVQPGTFQARDNISQFIGWCRGWLRVKECLLFETDDLVERKNERNVVLCLLEVARRGCDLCEGMPAPLLVQLEREIDAEVARDAAVVRRRNLIRRPSRLLDAATMTSALGVIESSDDGGNAGHEADDDDPSEDEIIPPADRPQVVTNDLRSLHQRVAELLNMCNCPSQFPMLRVADGKYRIGDTQVLIFVRVLRNHVMVRVGGGWDTLEHYLQKHDPCRGRAGRRLSMTKRAGSQQKLHLSQPRPRSCGTPSRCPGVPLESPSQRRRSFDLSSRLSSPDDARSPSLCSSRTPSRGSSPRGNTFAEEEDDWRSKRIARRPHPSDCSSSEEGDQRWRKNSSRQRKLSPRKVKRCAENGHEESEVDSIYSSPPRSLDSYRRGMDANPTKNTYCSDDSAVSTGTVEKVKLSSRSKIPKCSTPQTRGRHSSRLSSSRSEASLYSSFDNNCHSAKERTTSSAVRKSNNAFPRSNSGTNAFVTTPSRRRSASATRSPATPTFRNSRKSSMPKPTSANHSTCSSAISSCQSSPSKPVAPLLEEILHDSEHLDTDEKLLKRMEQLIDQYRCRAQIEDLEAELTEDTTTACFSLSLDDDEELSSLQSLMTLPSPNKTTKRTKRSKIASSARSPSRIPVFTAWQVKD